MRWKPAATLLAAILLAIAVKGQQAASPANRAALPAAQGRPVIGVALEGGGALGLAHIGVLQWMEEHHIPVDRVAGTSMGALVGSLYASGLTPAQLRAIAVSDAFTGVFTLQSPYADASFRRRQDRREIPQSITVGLRHGPQLRNALLTDRGVNEFLVTNMPAYNSGTWISTACRFPSAASPPISTPCNRSPSTTAHWPRPSAPPFPSPASFRLFRA